MNCRALTAESCVALGVILVLASSMLSCVCLPVTHGYPPPFPTEELLLEESAFPEGWQTDGSTYNPRERLPAEQMGLTYMRHECPYYSLKADHSVYRFFDGAKSAAAAYQQYIAIWFAPREGWDPWSVPAELPYDSAVADQFRLRCKTAQGGREFCQAVGQYEAYLVRFHVYMDSDPEYPDCMSFSDLERILLAIDERMALYLVKDME